MQLIFKNVGHGDSIIFNWQEDNDNFIGIIDCNKYGAINPVIQQLKKIPQLKKIKFILLSHPHADHYSGMLELLNYCNALEIKIDYFLHTMDVDPSNFKWAELETKNRILLREIVDKVIDLRKKNIIDKWCCVGEDWGYSINKNFNLKILSPSSIETHAFTQKIKSVNKYNRREASQAANLLSAIIEINYFDKKILLSSDGTQLSFHRIMEHIDSYRINLGQAPHHGSYENHCVEFWKNIEIDQSCPIVFSCGENIYALPHYEVIKWFADNNFTPHFTNIIYGAREFVQNSHKANIVANHLDDISELSQPMNLGQDQIFSY